MSRPAAAGGRFSPSLKIFLALFSLLAAAVTGAEVPKLSPAEAAQLVARGTAVLVDVREPAEWAETGIVTGAELLPKSDFDGAQKLWRPFLARTAGRRIILYCHSGRRAGIVAAALAVQGRPAANAGGFPAWRDAGQPVHRLAP